MPLLRRSRATGVKFNPDDVLWGVARREGYSDTDDPVQHEAALQHAFELGGDERAICGYEPPKRRSRVTPTPRPQLAVPGPSNPRCPRCDALLGIPPYGADVAPAEGVAAGASETPEEEAETVADAEWEPVAETEEQPKARRRRRSVRRGGTSTIAAGHRSITVRIGPLLSGRGIVADLDDAPEDVRITSVSVKPDGHGRINLNKAADVPINVSWFIVVAPEEEPS